MGDCMSTLCFSVTVMCLLNRDNVLCVCAQFLYYSCQELQETMTVYSNQRLWPSSLISQVTVVHHVSFHKG